jgi:FtsP/CotA-like multicopper oxidase with cupredoxin domain
MTTHHNTDAPRMGRRSFLKAAAATSGMALLSPRLVFAQGAAPLLRVGTRTIEVNKKAATVFHVGGPGNRSGILAREGERFKGALLNETGEPLQMHWHGQMRAANEQDRARPGGGALAAGQSDAHDFELTPGTHWMHSHTLSEQQLLAAPMVTLEKDSGDVQDVVIMLHDFAFRSPQEILAELGGTDAHAGHRVSPSTPRKAEPGPRGHMGHGGMPHHMTGHGPGHGQMMGTPHANDVRYDAYLANDRTLEDPETIRVEKGGRVRLRIINGATATAFFVTTPGLTTKVVAVDGASCRPFSAASYPLAQGQRIDLLAEIPKEGGAFPVLAQVEDAQFLTGVVLASPGATITKRPSTAERKAAMLDLALDNQLVASQPLAGKRPDKTFRVMLGEDAGYRWTINGRIHGEHEAFQVRQGERVEMTFMNPTSMMHPMHLHGHHFQVVAIGGRRFAGPVRDTVIVPAHMPVTVAFDAALKGAWFLHCHHLYHMATGMMTEMLVT